MDNDGLKFPLFKGARGMIFGNPVKTHNYTPLQKEIAEL